MAQFTVNPSRFDPYENFKFRVKWDGRYVAGVSNISALKSSVSLQVLKDAELANDPRGRALWTPHFATLQRSRKPSSIRDRLPRWD